MVLGSGFWVLGSGFWVLGSGFWVLGSGFFRDSKALDRKPAFLMPWLCLDIKKSLMKRKFRQKKSFA